MEVMVKLSHHKMLVLPPAERHVRIDALVHAQRAQVVLAEEERRHADHCSK